MDLFVRCYFNLDFRGGILNSQLVTISKSKINRLLSKSHNLNFPATTNLQCLLLLLKQWYKQRGLVSRDNTKPNTSCWCLQIQKWCNILLMEQETRILARSLLHRESTTSLYPGRPRSWITGKKVDDLQGQFTLQWNCSQLKRSRKERGRLLATSLQMKQKSP